MNRRKPPVPAGLGRRRGGGGGSKRAHVALCVVMVVALGAILLMATLQGSFVSTLRGQKRKHRAAVDRSSEPFEKSLAASLALLKEKKPNKDDRRGAGICSVVPSSEPGDSATVRVWTSYVADILSASRHPDDPNYSHLSWTKSLLLELSPSAMARSVVSYPPPIAVGNVLRIVRRRLYDPDKYPPLRIAVLGGAVTEGQGCEIASVDVPGGSIMANPTYCAWPYRFEQFVNALLGGSKVVEVTNLAEDGTDTAFMTPLLKNRIYPRSLLPDGPDVVVNAYTTHDYTSYDENGGGGTEQVENAMRNEMDGFIGAVSKSNRCGDPPLIVHMDDSGGNSAAGGTTTTMTIGKDRVLALRYGIPVSKVTRADRATEKVPQDLPFGMAGHLAMSWTLSFGIVDAILKHCSSSEEEKALKDDAETTTTTDREKCNDPTSPSGGNSPCVFAWFAGPMGTVTRPSQIQSYILPHVVDNTGWQVSSDMSTGFSRKSGLVAMEPNAKVTFRFGDVTKEVRYLNLMTLKSNGEEWMDGKARFALLVNEKKEEKDEDWQETSFEIEGYHESPTHITYHFGVDLAENRARVGSDVVLQIELVAGESFKILGIMLCS